MVSKCLEFAACRYDGERIANEFVKRLKPYVRFIPVCPEVEIGLGIPRDPILIISQKGELKLVQTTTDKDLSRRMTRFARTFLGSLNDVDGFILKSCSPSCGVKDVKLFRDIEAETVVGKGSGFFGRMVLDRFPDLPVETERRLSYPRIRRRFLNRLFGALIPEL